ncbi:hypothetical protein QTG54_001822 [Skeletonema marinoi]|uniref:Uncharacterized protein n=1 Tax=Skeletonema marinoi TaxID=267567 RepID=A0AAD8YLT3_9STRA|nr:hypothetical protein QTG54_001822 [Skeletonema marinoi]
MVTKTTDSAPAHAAEPALPPQQSVLNSEHDSVDAAKEVPKQQQQQQQDNKLDTSPLNPAAGDEKFEAKKAPAAAAAAPKAPDESGATSTKIQPVTRPAILSPPAIPAAASKPLATPHSSTPKVPTKSATRQRKALPPIAGHSLADPTVIAGVNSIIALLQSYGPLSYEQLKFNMATQLVPLNQPVKSDTKDKLQQVLGILVELGIIHQVDKASLGKNGNLMTKSAAKKLKEKKEEESSAAKEKEGESGVVPKSGTKSVDRPDLNPIYCFGNGIPRMDVVLPSQILSDIKESGEEVLRMQKRIEILRNALREIDETASEDKGKDDKVGNKSYEKAKGVLKQLLELHPEVVQDPVYAAALRMFKLKEGIPGLNEEDEERTLQNIHGSSGGKLKKRASASSLGSAEGSGKKKRKKGRPRKNSSANIVEKVATSSSVVKANASWT